MHLKIQNHSKYCISPKDASKLGKKFKHFFKGQLRLGLNSTTNNTLPTKQLHSILNLVVPLLRYEE